MKKNLYIILIVKPALLRGLTQMGFLPTDFCL